MSNPRDRALVAGAIALYWGLITLGGEFQLDPPGPLYDLWYSSAPWIAGIVLAFAAGLVVGRWLVLLVAAAPVLVLAGLQWAGHVRPWHDAGPPLTVWWELRGWWPLFWTLVVPLALGVLVRKGSAREERLSPRAG